MHKYLKSSEHQLDLILRTEIKIEFLNLFLLILDNFSQHFRAEGVSPGQLDSLPIDQIFSQQSYLSSFTQHPDHHRFLTQLSKTMCFSKLIEESFILQFNESRGLELKHPVPQQTLEYKKTIQKVVFYNKGRPSMLLIENRHILKALHKIKYNLVKSEMIQNYNSPVTISLKAYLVKYLQRLSELSLPIERPPQPHDMYNLDCLREVRESLIFDIQYIYKSSTYPLPAHVVSKSPREHKGEEINTIRKMNTINIAQYQKPEDRQST